MQKYNIILADPAWQYNDKAKKRGGAESHYKTMTLQDICDLGVQNIAADDCVLFMWCTYPMLAEGLKVIESWGFTYKTVAFTWIKANKRFNAYQASLLSLPIDDYMGMGRWTRSNAEICLLGVKGKPQRQSAKVRQVIYSPIRKHSQKPCETRDRIIELCGDLPRVELFAREKANGWASWGNEVKSDIVL